MHFFFLSIITKIVIASDAFLLSQEMFLFLPRESSKNFLQKNKDFIFSADFMYNKYVLVATERRTGVTNHQIHPRSDPSLKMVLPRIFLQNLGVSTTFLSTLSMSCSAIVLTQNCLRSPQSVLTKACWCLCQKIL